MSQSTTLSLALSLQADSLVLQVTNHSSHTEKIWELWNSWGWPTASLQVRMKEESQILLISPSKQREWTVNFPSFIEIKPGKFHEISLVVDSEWWEFSQDLSILKNHPCMVKAILDIPESPEAKEFGVFVGRIESEWIESKPPHRWLFQKD